MIELMNIYFMIYLKSFLVIGGFDCFVFFKVKWFGVLNVLYLLV